MSKMTPRKKARLVIKSFKADLIERATPAELQFKRILEVLCIKYKFQMPVRIKKEWFIVDFYLPQYQCVIEIDGGYHDDAVQAFKDEQRTAKLVQKGSICSVIRFTNDEVLNDKRGTELTLVNEIKAIMEQTTKSLLKLIDRVDDPRYTVKVQKIGNMKFMHKGKR
jgi:very-short-patch-repair endonuclease